MNMQDRMNRQVWCERGAISGLAALQGFTNEGERTAYWRIVDEVRNKPILDLGVGPGRTIKLLRSTSNEYVAIDYLPAMVEHVRKRFPFVDVRLGDARDLSSFGANTFYLVAFSYMGIDAVDHEGRQRILTEAYRVLQPGGIFWFSTLNKQGTAARARPWRLRWPPRGRGKMRYAVELLDQVMAVPRSTRNYLRNVRFSTEAEGWSIGPFFPNHYRLIVHYTTLGNQFAELQRIGFREWIAFDDDDGSTVNETDDLKHVFSFDILARK